MAFSEIELAEHTEVVERLFWSRRRPALQIRDKMREGQRISGDAIELFFVRPLFNFPGRTVEEPIAKIQFVRSRGVWRIFWKRADNKWHSYPAKREVKSLAAALRVIDADAHHCFFG